MKYSLIFAGLLAFVMRLDARQMPTYQQEAIEKLFASELGDMGPGIALAIWQDGELTYQHTSGLANIEQGTQIDKNTPFHLGFMTQQFLDYGLSKLIDQGQLSINDLLIKYVEELSPAFQNIRLKHLINHSSGIPDYWAMRSISGWGYDDPQSTEQAMEMIRGIQALNHPPGEKVIYSNSNHLLLARVIEKVSGQSIPEFLHTTVFRPLNFESAYISNDHGQLISSRANAYFGDTDGWKASFSSNPDIGSTGLYASLEDLKKWIKHLDKVTETSGIDLWQTGSYHGKVYNFRPGFYNGYRGFIGRFTRERLSIIILSNSYYLNTETKARQIADLLYPGAAQGTTFNFETSHYKGTYEPEDYTGHYWDDKDYHARSVQFTNDTLYYVTPDGWQSALQPVALHTFKMLNSRSGLYAWFTPEGTEMVLNVGRTPDAPARYKAYTPHRPPHAELKSLEGQYYAPTLKVFYELKEENGKIMARHLRKPALRLDPLDKDRYANEDEWYFSEIRFQRDQRSRVTGFLVNTPEITDLLFIKVDLPK